MDKIKTVVILTVILNILLEEANGDPTKCAGGLTGITPGYTIPFGDLTKQYGESLSIKCIIDLSLAKGLNSSHIIFTYGDNEFPKNLTRIIDERTAELFLEKPDPMSQMFFCALRDPVTRKDTSVCMNYVTIGTPPQDPDDFHCISNNYSNLTCEFHPKKNYVTTDYEVQFYLPFRTKRFKYNCTNLKANEAKKTLSCFWDLSTPVQYRQAHDKYTFIVTMKNQFGKREFIYNFSHYENVIPARPSFMEIRDKTPHSADIVWNVTRPMNAFTPGLHHMIKYISEYENKTTQWKVADTSSIPKDAQLQYHFNLTGLKYAYALYDVRVQIKSAVAANETSKWSDYNSETFRTLAEIPSRPPRIAISSFEVVNKLSARDILIYWQTLEEYEKNGPDFRYSVEIKENGHLLSRSPDKIKNNYANFTDLAFDKEYEFSLVSVNSKGRSVNNSVIYVPKKDQIVNRPSFFTKISLSDFVYQLSWKRPSGVQNISNYTIFWCQSGFERPAICPNSLEWDTVSANETTHNVTVETNKNYQFAISVNTPTSSSGMSWAICTVRKSGVGKMRTVSITSVGDTYMTVSWILECSELIGVVTFFRVYYCIIPKPDGVCEGEKQHKDFLPTEEIISATITGLQPYTTYQVNVSVISKEKEGLPSDPLYFTTFEAAPTQPLNLRTDRVTNISIALSWDAPERINGVFKNYTIVYGIYRNNTKDLYGNREITVNNMTQRQITLHGLYGYTDYWIYVRACTSLCSNSSKVLYIRTLISHPSKILLPRFNDTTFLMSWQPPEHPGGHLDYYEILFTRKRDDITTQELYRTNKTEFTLPDASCDIKSETSFSFHVRAVNRLPGDPQTLLAGNWSDPYGNICFPGKYNSNALIWTFGIVVGCAVFALIVYLSKRLFEYIQDLKKIEVRLPPGISSAIAKEKGDKFLYDETSLLPPKSDKLFSTLDNNTINSTFTSKGISDDSGLHNKSDDIISDKWLNSNINNDDLSNMIIKLENIQSSPREEWLNVDEGDKKTSDGYLANSGKYCLVGADSNTSNKPTHGYVQAVMPMQNHIQKPYESFECTTLNPYIDTLQNNTDSTLTYQHMPPMNTDKSNTGYLPITCLPSVEHPTRSLLSPNTPEDSQDDDDTMSHIKTSLKRSDTSPGYVVVEAANSDANKIHTPLIPVNVSNLNSAIPKGYVKAAEIPCEKPSVDNTLYNQEVNKTNSYVALGEVNKHLNSDISSKKLLNKSNVNPHSSISNGYVQHTINN